MVVLGPAERDAEAAEVQSDGHDRFQKDSLAVCEPVICV